MAKGKPASSGIQQKPMMEHFESHFVDKSTPTREEAIRDFTNAQKPAGNVNQAGQRKPAKKSAKGN